MAARSLPPCRYGAGCYRANAQHRAQYSHPTTTPPSSTNASKPSAVNDNRKRKADTAQPRTAGGGGGGGGHATAAPAAGRLDAFMYRAASPSLAGGSSSSSSSSRKPVAVDHMSRRGDDDYQDDDDVVIMTPVSKRGRTSEASLSPVSPQAFAGPSPSTTPHRTGGGGGGGGGGGDSSNGGYGDFVDNVDPSGGWGAGDRVDDTDDLPSTQELPPLRIARQATYIADQTAAGASSSSSSSSSSSADNSSDIASLSSLPPVFLSSSHPNNHHASHISSSSSSSSSNSTRTPPRVQLLTVPKARGAASSSAMVHSPSTSLAGLGTLSVSTPIPRVQPAGGNTDYTPSSPATWAADIATRFHLQLPLDFIPFWDTLKQLATDRDFTNPSASSSSSSSRRPSIPLTDTEWLLHILEDTLGIVLCGPFDLVAGRFDSPTINKLHVNFDLHCRYAFDSPELVTVIRGTSLPSAITSLDGSSSLTGAPRPKKERKKRSTDDYDTDDDEPHTYGGSKIWGINSGIHWGYWRDDPTSLPSFVVSNHASYDYKMALRGDNLFAAVLSHIDDIITLRELSDDHKSTHRDDERVWRKIDKIRTVLTKAAKAGTFDLTTGKRSRGWKLREPSIVAPLYHGLGLVVPWDREADIGYRELGISDDTLKTMIMRMDRQKSTGVKVNYEDLDQLLNRVTYANDERDPGMGLHVGFHLFCLSLYLRRDARKTMSMAYELIGRRAFMKCIEDHSDVVIASLPASGAGMASSAVFGSAFCEVARNTASVASLF